MLFQQDLAARTEESHWKHNWIWNSAPDLTRSFPRVTKCWVNSGKPAYQKPCKPFRKSLFKGHTRTQTPPLTHTQISPVSWVWNLHVRSSDLTLHSSTSHRNLTWPNCVKSILTQLHFSVMASLVHRFPGECTHPAPPLMKVGIVPPILHPGSQHVPPHAYAFRKFLASYSQGPFPIYHFNPSAFHSVKQKTLRGDGGKNFAETKLFEICQKNIQKEGSCWGSSGSWGGSRGKQELENAMEMSKPYPATPQGSP